MEGSVEDPGPPGGREVQPGSAGLPLHGCGKAGAAATPRVRCQRGSFGSAGSGRKSGGRCGGFWGWGGAAAVPTHAPLHGIGGRGVGPWGRFPLFFPLSFFCYFLGASYIFLGRAWAEGKGELATCRAAMI